VLAALSGSSLRATFLRHRVTRRGAPQDRRGHPRRRPRGRAALPRARAPHRGRPRDDRARHPARAGHAGRLRHHAAPLAHALGRPGLVDREIAAAHDLELCGWDVDTHDWRGDAAEAMLASVGPELHAGAIVLLHDGLGPGARRQGCEETVRFTRMMAAESVAHMSADDRSRRAARPGGGRRAAPPRATASPPSPTTPWTALAQAGRSAGRGRSRASGSSCAPWRRPTARSGASSTATTTRGAHRRCWPTSRCAAPTWRRWRPGGGGWGLGRRPGRGEGEPARVVRTATTCASKASRPSARAPAGSTARSSWPTTATLGASPTSTSPKASRSTARGSPPSGIARVREPPRPVPWRAGPRTARRPRRAAARPLVRA
jgi:hypothetical protein